jgi:hypothetical protein
MMPKRLPRRCSAHPWFGLRVGVHAAIDKPDGVVFRCSLSSSESGRWLEVPAWMFDRAACAKVRVAADAHVELAALTAVAALLRQVLNDHLASSNAPLSGVLGVSREPNRGELHATPDQAAAGAPPGAAADRPVRRRTAREDRKRARRKRRRRVGQPSSSSRLARACARLESRARTRAQSPSSPWPTPGSG